MSTAIDRTFTLYPAIDLKDGRAVRLRQGELSQATMYFPQPAEAARRWVTAGARWLHVVDLDGAFSGTSRNLTAIRAIVAAVPGVSIQVGGGLRSLEAIEKMLGLGVTRVILGTAALDGDLVERAIEACGTERIVCGIDAKNGMVATAGWVNMTEIQATDLAARLGALGVQEIVYTDISRDGMLTGPNFAAIERLAAATPAGVIAAGGVASMADLERLMQIPNLRGAILGKSLYEGKIDLARALAAIAR